MLTIVLGHGFRLEYWYKKDEIAQWLKLIEARKPKPQEMRVVTYDR